MEKISRTVYPAEPIILEQWWKEFNIGRLASKPSHQAKNVHSLFAKYDLRNIYNDAEACGNGMNRQFNSAVLDTLGALSAHFLFLNFFQVFARCGRKNIPHFYGEHQAKNGERQQEHWPIGPAFRS